MATRTEKRKPNGELANADSTDSAVDGSEPLANVRPAVRTLVSFTPFALMLAGWLFFWIISLRLLFLQDRLLEFTVGIGLMLLPIAGILGWMALKARRRTAVVRH